LHRGRAMSATSARTLRAPSRFWALTFHIGPDLILVTAFALTLAVLMLVYGAKLSFVHASIVMPLVVLAVLVASTFVRGRGWRTASEMLRDWFPLILHVFIYENLHDLTDAIRPEIVDGSLRALDTHIFGVEPTIALQKITTPWLTELMSFGYMLYFVYPAAVLTILYVRDEFYKFREFGMALGLCFYLGLLGYLLVPAIGPRYAMAHEFTVPLQGIWLTERAAAAWDMIESIKRDCFPSLHTGLTTVSLIYMWRYRKVWRFGKALLGLCTPFIVLLWCSTIYLRYHYTVDVMAGFALAITCCYAAPMFVRWYYQRKTGEAPMLSIDQA
jgi:membrane-associated phospholipid phosphatase